MRSEKQNKTWSSYQTTGALVSAISIGNTDRKHQQLTDRLWSSSTTSINQRYIILLCKHEGSHSTAASDSGCSLQYATATTTLPVWIFKLNYCIS